MEYQKYELRLHKCEVRDSEYNYDLTQVECSKDLYQFAKDVLQMDKMPEERLYTVQVNSKGNVIGYTEVSKGEMNNTIASCRKIYEVAMHQNAAAIFCIHNHPSGDTTPSAMDIATTKKMQMAGQILGINLMDHIIVSENGYYSLRGNGFMEDVDFDSLEV